MYERHDKHELQIQFVACLKSRNIQAGRLALPYSFFTSARGELYILYNSTPPC